MSAQPPPPAVEAPRGCFGRLKQRLFTREDPIHLHKTLGILCVLSFLYRYCVVLPVTGTLGFEGNLLDWATMFLHIGLSTSSLIFHVIRRRKINRPMIIWEEYRQHAIVFSLRCFSVYVFHQVCPASVPEEIRRVALFCLVLAHHLVVDDITRRHGNHGHTTVRVDGDSTLWTKMVLRGYSFYQFLALASHLIPHPRSSDLGFNTLIAIQSSAFLMTLYRKALVSKYTHGVVYSACLLLSGSYIISQFPEKEFVLGVLAAFLLRVRYRLDKYKLWAAFCALGSPSIRALLMERVMALRSRVALPDVSDLRNSVDLRSLSLRDLNLNRVDFAGIGQRVSNAVDFGGIGQRMSNAVDLGGIGQRVSNAVDFGDITQRVTNAVDLGGISNRMSNVVDFRRVSNTIAYASTSQGQKYSATAICFLALVAYYWIASAKRQNRSRVAPGSPTASSPLPRATLGTAPMGVMEMAPVEVAPGFAPKRAPPTFDDAFSAEPVQ